MSADTGETNRGGSGPAATIETTRGRSSRPRGDESIEQERKIRELTFVREIGQLAASTRDWDEMLRIVIDRTTGVMGAEVASLYLVERREGLLRLAATNGLNPRGIGRATLRIGEGITGWVANAHVPLSVRDVHGDPRWKRVPAVDVERFTSMLSVPLVMRDEVIGVLNVQTVEAREFDRTEIDFLQTIANQLAGIIDKARLHRDAERQLREVSALFEVSNVLTSTLDLDEVLALVVDRLVRVYPGSSGAIVLHGEADDDVRARSGELARSALQASRRAIEERRPIVGEEDVALPLLAGDRLLGAAVLHVPGRAEFGDEEIAFVGTLANQAALAIDKASLYARERATTESLRELERARADLIAVVTHDLRTPLSVIRGYLDLLKGNGAKGVTTEAIAQVERLDLLVDRILAGVRADAPDLEMRRARFDLRDLVVSQLGELSTLARRHRVRGPRRGRPVTVRGDRRRTADVLAALVHNASKYAPEATDIRISISALRDRAVVSVADRGPGIAPQDRTRVFEPYVRLGDQSKTPGSGVGLYAARRLAEAQGGDIWCEEHSGGGSVFSFSIPLAKR